jgi:hypothetical protein
MVKLVDVPEMDYYAKDCKGEVNFFSQVSVFNNERILFLDSTEGT